MEVVRFDCDGYLVSGTWDVQVAKNVARQLDVELTEDHWNIIECVRCYWVVSGRSPSMRPLVKLIQNHLGRELGNSITLSRLFPPPTSGCVAKISGTPKPSDCL
ncbi:MAG: TusE/DsrC/DsvC family sulfur relay protein [Gammaproteobacteria bacterium]|nr:TusE/DsrC/DsvC family sulfur relay protein [Gammaproteobacteria bacterium]